MSGSHRRDGERGRTFVPSAEIRAWHPAGIDALHPAVYPEVTQRLFPPKPIGLEDWRAMGVPYVLIERIRSSELTDRVAAMIPDVRVTDFDGVGHLPHIETPRRYPGAMEKIVE